MWLRYPISELKGKNPLERLELGFHWICLIPALSHDWESLHVECKDSHPWTWNFNRARFPLLSICDSPCSIGRYLRHISRNIADKTITQSKKAGVALSDGACSYTRKPHGNRSTSLEPYTREDLCHSFNCRKQKLPMRKYVDARRGGGEILMVPNCISSCM